MSRGVPMRPMVKRERDLPHRDLSEALCRGQWHLFDSTDPRDHLAAKELCDACPALLACRQYLTDVRETSVTALGGTPTGTWAGLLVGSKRELRGAS